MKRFILSLIILLLFSLLFSLPIFAAESVTLSEITAGGLGSENSLVRQMIKSYNDNYGDKYGELKESITLLDGKTYEANNAVAKKYGFIVYGTPTDISSVITSGLGIVPQELKQAYPAYGGEMEYRYLGFTPNGFPFTNDRFPNDAGPSDSQWANKWIWEAWEKPNGAHPPQPLVPGNFDESHPKHFEAIGWIREAIDNEDKEWFCNVKKDMNMCSKLDGTYENSSYYGQDLTRYFSIVSPLTDYTAFSCVGWHMKGGTLYYNTFVTPPQTPSSCDLAVEIVSTGTLSSPKAKIRTTIVNDTGLGSTVPRVFYRCIVGGEVKPWVVDELTITKTGETQDLELSWAAEPGNEVLIQAIINPVLDESGNPLFNADWTPVEEGKRLINETDYDNNFDEADISSPSPYADEKKFLEFEYEFHPVVPIKINPSTNAGRNEHRIFTYTPNTIIMESSIYTETIEIAFRDTYKLILTQKGNGSPSYQQKRGSNNTDCFYNVSLTVQQVNVNSAAATSSYEYTAEKKKVWTLRFSLKNYSIYPAPHPDEPQFDILKIEAFDHNGQKIKFPYAEINPLYYSVNIRQTKLFNLRVSDVKDIYWKYVFNHSSGSPKEYNDLQDSKPSEPPFGVMKMPVAGNQANNNRLISKGYAVQMKIDTEGLQASDDSLVIRPSFWWYDAAAKDFKEADLYYDIVNKNLYNVPIESDSTILSDKLDKVVSAYPVSQRSAVRQVYKDNMLDSYSRLTIEPAEKLFEDKILMSGRKIWEFRSNSLDNPDNYYKRFQVYRNTWTFTYSLHPATKAFLKGANPNTARPLTGAILVNLKIVSNNGTDNTWYNYTKLEDTWNNSNGSSPLNFTTSYDTGSGGHGNTFYFNLDWSALDDYSTQQKW